MAPKDEPARVPASALQAYIARAFVAAGLPDTDAAVLGDGPALAATLGAYLLLQVAYTLALKHIAYVGAFVIAIGFVLRIVAGGIGAGVPLTPWIVALGFLLALLLALGKRHGELVNARAEGSGLRYDRAMLERTSTDYAPWHVVPADHKWFARVVIGSAIVSALDRLDLKFPKADKASLQEFEAVRVALEHEGKGGKKVAAKETA